MILYRKIYINNNKIKTCFLRSFLKNNPGRVLFAIHTEKGPRSALTFLFFRLYLVGAEECYFINIYFFVIQLGHLQNVPIFNLYVCEYITFKTLCVYVACAFTSQKKRGFESLFSSPFAFLAQRAQQGISLLYSSRAGPPVDPLCNNVQR